MMTSQPVDLDGKEAAKGERAAKTLDLISLLNTPPPKKRR